MKHIYMDNNATTPIDKEVVEEMISALKDSYGNPSSIHIKGQQSAKHLERARERVASAINCDTKEILFTSGGTEADNLAIKGYALKNRKKGNHIITSEVEHPAVLETCKYLAKNGFEVTYLGTDKNGVVSLDRVKSAVKDSTILITIMHANNEVGAIQPVKEIADFARERKIVFHTDAVQSFGKFFVDVKELGVDMLSMSSHKINGPKGVGALFVRKGIRLEPMIHGGHQQKMKRPGTENLSGIIGFGKAAELIEDKLKATHEVKSLRNKFEELVEKEIPHVTINAKGGNRVSNTSNICFHFIEGEAVALSLSRKGICVSTGSACASGSLEPSHVLASMKVPIEHAQGAIRFSLSQDNTEAEIVEVVNALKQIVNRMREMSPLYEDMVNEQEHRRIHG